MGKYTILINMLFLLIINSVYSQNQDISVVNLEPITFNSANINNLVYSFNISDSIDGHLQKISDDSTFFREGNYVVIIDHDRYFKMSSWKVYEFCNDSIFGKLKNDNILNSDFENKKLNFCINQSCLKFQSLQNNLIIIDDRGIPTSRLKKDYINMLTFLVVKDGIIKSVLCIKDFVVEDRNSIYPLRIFATCYSQGSIPR